MFRLITFICLLHVSVGTIIHGRVLLNGDAKQVENVPAGSRLIIRLEDTSMADASAIVIKEVVLSNLLALPLNYRIEVPTVKSSDMPYTLSAFIKKDDLLLYTNEVYIPVTLNTKGSITKNIPVVVVGRVPTTTPSFVDNEEHLSWPELVGREGTYAVQYIKEKTGFTNVPTIPEGSMVTMDFRMDRVRVFVDENGIVTQTPHVA